MAYSYTRYTGDGSTDQYAINFTLGYISRDDVHAYINDVPTTFTWITSGMIKLDSIPAVGDHVLLRRIVDSTELVHDYADGAVVIERNLDESNLQTLMLMHEVLDGFIDLDINDELDLRTNRIVNVGDPINPQDAATKYYVDEVTDVAVDAGNAAAVSATASAASADDSAASAADAQTVLDNFTDIYHGALAAAPTANVDVGDLYFDLPSNTMLVYNATEWKPAGGESNMFIVNATGEAGSTVVSIVFSSPALLVMLNGYTLPPSEFICANDGLSITVLNTEEDDEIQILTFASLDVSEGFSCGGGQNLLLDSNPTRKTEHPDDVGGLAVNKMSGEVFTCIQNIPDRCSWIGQLGTRIIAYPEYSVPVNDIIKSWNYDAAIGQLKGVAFNELTGDMIISVRDMSSQNFFIRVMDGLSNVVKSSFACPKDHCRIACYNGQLFLHDADNVYIMDGISGAILYYWDAPTSYNHCVGVDKDTGNLLTTSESSDKYYIHNGLTSSYSQNVNVKISNGSSRPGGITYTGRHVIVQDANYGNRICVFDDLGISATVQTRWSVGAANGIVDVAWSGTHLVSVQDTSDTSQPTIIVYKRDDGQDYTNEVFV